MNLLNILKNWGELSNRRLFTVFLESFQAKTKGFLL
jgi:hypothetical protein